MLANCQRITQYLWIFFQKHLWTLNNIDPENSLVLMETNLPTPMTARVYVNLPEGIISMYPLVMTNIAMEAMAHRNRWCTY